MGIALWIEQNIGTQLLMVHDKIYKSTDGRIGHRFPIPGVAPNLLLHAVGAKTGKRRTNSLSYSVVPDDPDYARMWKLVNEQNPDHYNGYQKRTSRPIPIVRLTPKP